MPHTSALLGFALVCLGLVLTPGPNMIYLITRSITQGPAAGIVSLGDLALTDRLSVAGSTVAQVSEPGGAHSQAAH